jgi:NADH-ubiquinone oxidoreductase chain 5
MAAPTPVSALVHSSTLVTAGVYLLIRFNFILLNSGLGQFLLLIGGLTIFMAGLGANYEIDLKKIIALSTLSQLGLIIRILSFGFYKLAFFHLLTHALFKALLFICAGVIIHQIKNSQDIRFMGRFINFIPLTRIFFSVSNIALCGMPFLAGFYSKDLILEIIYFYDVNILVFFLFIISTGLTVCYSFRLFYYSLIRNYQINNYVVISDNLSLILKRITGLLIMSIIGGRLLS